MKRIFDIIASALLIVVFSPLLVFVYCLIRLSNIGPVFFIQERPGVHSQKFQMIKFRTMKDNYSSHGVLLPDEARLTALGKIIRSLSIDELPELWNVLKGDMSLVGPRPLLMEYLPLYSAEQARRHAVKPGITGWAQVNGRNSLSWEDKFKLDVWYVDNQSFWLDIKILLMTIKKVFCREGISADGHVTMNKFTGNHS